MVSKLKGTARLRRLKVMSHDEDRPADRLDKKSRVRTPPATTATGKIDVQKLRRRLGIR